MTSIKDKMKDLLTKDIVEEINRHIAIEKISNIMRMEDLTDEDLENMVKRLKKYTRGNN